MAPSTSTAYRRDNKLALCAPVEPQILLSDTSGPRTLPIATQLNILQNIESLKTNSYIRFNPSSFLGLSPREVEKGIKILQEEIDVLPADPYAPVKVQRFRRYSRAVILPWEKPWKVHWIPGFLDADGVELAGYNQGKFNPEHADERRFFPTVPQELRDLRLLNRLILADVSLCDWSPDEMRHPIIVGIHFVKTAPTPEHPVSVTTPNALHQDGHKFSFVHLIRRRNAAGGMNAIAEPQYAGCQPEDVPKEHLKEKFYLEEELESWGAYDDKVSHYAGPVRQQVPGPEPSERSVFILDIEPMRAWVCPI